ncbi:hypothetical protein [Actinomadura coerulea]|uniref:hypothetical protein n=1 Tax=Actinomadura coerulea TaxID=46159 RepID=UPI00343756CF
MLDFLRTSNTTGRQEAEQAYTQAPQGALHEEINPISDRETRALREQEPAPGLSFPRSMDGLGASSIEATLAPRSGHCCVEFGPRGG